MSAPSGTSVSGDTARPGRDDAPDPEPQSTVATPVPAPALTPAPTIILKALGLVWIRVRDPGTGRVVVEGIMKQGNEVTLPDKASLVLDAGRPNQIEFSIGGKSAGLAGASAAVRHNISLDPDRDWSGIQPPPQRAKRPRRRPAAPGPAPETPKPGIPMRKRSPRAGASFSGRWASSGSGCAIPGPAGWSSKAS